MNAETESEMNNNNNNNIMVTSSLLETSEDNIITLAEVLSLTR